MSFLCSDPSGDSPSSGADRAQLPSPEQRIAGKLSMSVEEERSPSSCGSGDCACGDSFSGQKCGTGRSPLTETQPCGRSRVFKKPKTKTFSKELSSPLGRMCLLSPTGSLPLSGNSSDSDGYFVEELNGGEVYEKQPCVSSAVSTLLHSTHFDLSSEQRREPVKRPSPLTNVNEHCRCKRPPLPFDSCSPSALQQGSEVNSSTPLRGSTGTSLKGSVLFRAHSSPTTAGELRLIGDFTKPFVLPLVEGSIGDLNCISADTLSALLMGKFAAVTSYTIIDCRYPYEYEGGHIDGASNLWTDKKVKKGLFSEPLAYPREGSRDIFIFHCEFSSKRGPEKSRFLREYDRRINESNYPKLYYPEVYLLDGGYRAFYAKYSDLCNPKGYCPMDDKAHIEELKACKTRSKSEKLRTCQFRSKSDFR